MSTKKRFVIRNPGFSLLVLGFFILCLTLSYWQYTRAATKTHQIQQLKMRTGLAPLSVAALQGKQKDLRFYAIKLEGYFDSQKAFLLDNKIESGRVGYEVYIPFYAKGLTHPVLVDRGFIAQGPSRQVLPNIPHDYKEHEIVGMLNAPPSHFSLGKMVGERQPTWPLRIQYVGLDQMGAWLGAKLYPYVLIQNVTKIDDHFIEKLVAVTPERHKGYAFQWFALAVTLLILFFVLNRTS